MEHMEWVRLLASAPGNALFGPMQGWRDALLGAIVCVTIGAGYGRFHRHAIAHDSDSTLRDQLFTHSAHITATSLEPAT